MRVTARFCLEGIVGVHSNVHLSLWEAAPWVGPGQTDRGTEPTGYGETERESLREIHFKELAPTIVKACWVENLQGARSWGLLLSFQPIRLGEVTLFSIKNFNSLDDETHSH